MLTIHQSTTQYERWLTSQLEGDVVAKDLQRKHKKMRDTPFSFLRATYWRWAETVLEVCPELGKAPVVLAVGDIHLENFGTWRDVEGRLIWGVNDFDEAAEMPYVLDLVRLATSAVLAQPRQGTVAETIAVNLLEGYRQGLDAPSPIVLDRKARRLRQLVVVTDEQRKDFWNKIEEEKQQKEKAPPRYLEPLVKAMPAKGIDVWTARRISGTGSLGRPRWIAVGDWQGGEVVREAKALVLSGWCRAHPEYGNRMRCREIANGSYRAVDPWQSFRGGVTVRRLSPNNRKIEAAEPVLQQLSPKLLQAMGRDLAGAHLGVKDKRRALTRDLDTRGEGWLAKAAIEMARFARKDFKDYGPARAR